MGISIVRFQLAVDQCDAGVRIEKIIQSNTSRLAIRGEFVQETVPGRTDPSRKTTYQHRSTWAQAVLRMKSAEYAHNRSGTETRTEASPLGCRRFERA